MPSGFYDSKGQLQRLSFTDAFLGAYVSQRTLRTPKKTAKIVETRKSTTVAATPPPADPPADPPAAPPAAPPTDAPAPSPSAGALDAGATPAALEEAKPAETTLAWTALEDATLIGLKALNKTWKEIGAIMTDKPTEDLRERYDELNLKTVKATEPETKQCETKECEPKPDEAKADEGGGTASDHGGKNKGKGKKGKENKEMSDEAKEKKAKAMEAKAKNAEEDAAKEEATDTETGSDVKGKPLKGILKKGKGSKKDKGVNHEPTHYQGRAIIFVDGGDALNVAELMNLYRLHQTLENKKWVELSSKFFDKTGRRASPELLRERLKHC